MFDGFKSWHDDLSPGAWLENPVLVFTAPLVLATGEVLDKSMHYEHEGLRFVIRPSKVQAESLLFELGGSLHKYHNSGKHNTNDFNLSDVRKVLARLKDQFGIDLQKARLRTIEIGVNLALPDGLTTSDVLKSVIAFKNQRFTELRLRDNGPKYGKACHRTEYRFKIYDKGKQSDQVRKDLLRVEVKVLKMRKLEPFGIHTLADLIRFEKVASLGDWIANFIADLILVDQDAINRSLLTRNQLLDLEKWTNPARWENWNRMQRARQRKRLGKFLAQYSSSTLQADLCTAIVDKWDSLMQVKQESGIRFHQDFDGIEAEERYTFSPFNCAVKTYHRGEEIRNVDNSQFLGPQKNQSYPHLRTHRMNHRECITCGRNISDQRKDSVFCSERTRGKAAKACRNVDSNRRRTFNRRIMKAKERHVWLLISYMVDGQSYADTLHASEVAAGDSWLNAIESLELLYEEPPKVLTGEEARALINRLSQENA